MDEQFFHTLFCIFLSPYPRSQALPSLPSLGVWKSRGSLVSFLMWAWCNWRKFVKITGCVLHIFNRLHAQHLVCTTVTSHYLHVDTCGKLPGTLTLFAVLGQVCPHTIKSFLPSFLSWHHWVKIPGPLLHFRTANDGKLGGGWERGYIHLHVLYAKFAAQKPDLLKPSTSGLVAK